MKYFGNKVLILDQSGGSGFVCSCEVKLGNAMAKLLKMDENIFAIHRVYFVLLIIEIYIVYFFTMVK